MLRMQHPGMSRDIFMKKDFDYESLSGLPLFNGIRTDELETLLTCLNARESRYKKNHFIVIDTEKMPFVGIILLNDAPFLAGRSSFVVFDFYRS